MSVDASEPWVRIDVRDYMKIIWTVILFKKYISVLQSFRPLMTHTVNQPPKSHRRQATPDFQHL
jgi:hypothetical protein